jgi:single-strand selective monofunctional uracil DNA glycosylase
MELVKIAAGLRDAVGQLDLVGGAVSHVYNPVDYAWEPHRRYLERYGDRRPEVVLLGMNPGPWGMAQTGVPLGVPGTGVPGTRWGRVPGTVYRIDIRTVE